MGILDGDGDQRIYDLNIFSFIDFIRHRIPLVNDKIFGVRTLYDCVN